jgi:hypothetical protein
MNTYRVWLPEEGYDYDENRTVADWSPEDAARDWVEEEFASSGDYPSWIDGDPIVVHVECAKSKKQWTVAVSLEIAINCRADDAQEVT